MVVVIKNFEGTFPGGRIMTVRPSDPDATGLVLMLCNTSMVTCADYQRLVPLLYISSRNEIIDTGWNLSI